MIFTKRKDLQRSRHEQELGAMMIKYAVYLLLAVVGIIGFANLANTMIINITTKRREYGIMQAVGMTGRQLGRGCLIRDCCIQGGRWLCQSQQGYLWDIWRSNGAGNRRYSA